MNHKLLPILTGALVLLSQTPAQINAQGVTERDLLGELGRTPHAFVAYVDLATLYRDQGRFTDAIRTLEGAISLLRDEQREMGQPAPPRLPPGVPVRVGGDIQPPSKTKHVDPVYPASARAARLSGTVFVEVTIDTSGRVAETRVVRSFPPFDAAALAAVRQWEWAPTFLGGFPVPLIMTVSVTFTP